MINLTSADVVEVKGRGTMYTFHAVPKLNPRLLLQQLVMIDDVVYRVRGVESYALYDVTGLPFGLLVEDVRMDEGAPR